MNDELADLIERLAGVMHRAYSTPPAHVDEMTGQTVESAARLTYHQISEWDLGVIGEALDALGELGEQTE